MSFQSTLVATELHPAAKSLTPPDGTCGPPAEGWADRPSAQELVPRFYEELRRLAGAKMAREPPGQTLQATALVHDTACSARPWPWPCSCIDRGTSKAPPPAEVPSLLNGLAGPARRAVAASGVRRALDAAYAPDAYRRVAKALTGLERRPPWAVLFRPEAQSASEWIRLLEQVERDFFAEPQ